MMLIIDPHVHLRDFTQCDSETILHALQISQKVGIAALFEMPNTSPPLMSRTQILRRLQWANDAASRISAQRGHRPFHAMYAGISADLEQVKEVVELQKEYAERIIGFKMYAGHSTGNLGVCCEGDRAAVWQTLAKLDCRGFVAVHCEKEDLFSNELWQEENVASHSAARPESSEVASIAEQIELARSASFRGRLHIAHISTAEGVELVKKARQEEKFAISCGVCPHHLCLNTQSYAQADQALFLKVNPPLRSPTNQQRLWQQFCAGDIDWLESDHAPHSLEAKLQNKASGIPGLVFFRFFVDELHHNSKLEEGFIHKMSALNVQSYFKLPCPLEQELPQISKEQWQELFNAYPGDPYSQLLRNGLTLFPEQEST